LSAAYQIRQAIFASLNLNRFFYRQRKFHGGLLKCCSTLTALPLSKQKYFRSRGCGLCKYAHKRWADPGKDQPLLTYEKHQIKYLKGLFYILVLQKYRHLKTLYASNDTK
jgi:hypothetical protein